MNLPSAAGFTQSLFDCRDAAVAGGKAINLGRLLRAGFPAPAGFVVTTHAHRAADGAGVPDAVAADIRAAYRAIGGGAVAVRSYAPAEDMAGASMAGQYETFLDIEGEENVVDAVRRCWESLHAPRIRAYLKEHEIDPARVAMAVVVQRLVPADVAGVLFTANPQNSTRREMLIEASWGLGESVVSGRVQPDVLHLDFATGRVLAATIADKQTLLAAGNPAQQPVDDARRRQPCLKGRDVHALWQLGRRIAAHFGAPQDIEWAISGGEIFLLQSRPITTRQEAEAYDDVLRDTRRHLREEIAAGRGPWALHNLAETLAHPTPLTWSVIRGFMSGAGGFGEMYRHAGFAPSAAVCRDGFLELIAGRIYMDAARMPEMFFEGFPFAYDLEELKRSPDASQSPPTLPRGSFSARASAEKKLGAVQATLRKLAAGYDRILHAEAFPAIARYVAEARKTDLAALTAEDLIALWHRHEAQALQKFAPQSLMPSLISGMALGELLAFLAEHFWDEDPDALAQLISSGGPANRTLLADAELYEVAKGNRTLEAWLADHGHRASWEFDLASPRWRETPAAAQEMAAHLAKGEAPMERHERHSAAVNQRLDALRSRLPRSDRAELDRRVDLVRRYVAFREDGKDFLMLGYDLLRDVALEAGRRLEAGPDVFYLTREDLFDSLRVGFAPFHLIEQRKAAYQAEARMTLPRVIDAAALESLGESPRAAAPAAGGHKAFCLSGGTATGLAVILHSPTDAGELTPGYILVCPSTDPSWTPLFANAAGLVLECGGTLSHGAVVAREMGLPAVVLPEATRIFSPGQHISLNGDDGWVGPAPDAAAAQGAANPPPTPATPAVDPEDTRVAARLIPPPAGAKDRRAAKVRNIAALLWAVFLLAFFLLPAHWAAGPTIAAMDTLLWPLVRAIGRPATVALVAAALALVTLLIQRFGTDNPRLLEAKKRAAALRKQAATLPVACPRQKALERLAAPVQWRTLLAALLPVGLLLGPMCLPFVWFAQRIDPLLANAPPGSALQIVATIDGEYTGPLKIELPPGLTLRSGQPVRTLPPTRAILQHLLVLYRLPHPQPADPWEVQLAPDLSRDQTAADLQAYLAAGLPPQGITWQVDAAAGGDFAIKVTAGEPQETAVAATVRLGDDLPPGVKKVLGPAGSPLRQVELVYPKPNVEPEFWRPLAFMGGRLGAWDIGWLWLYVLAYVPVLFFARWALRVA